MEKSTSAPLIIVNGVGTTVKHPELQRAVRAINRLSRVLDDALETRSPLAYQRATLAQFELTKHLVETLEVLADAADRQLAKPQRVREQMQ